MANPSNKTTGKSYNKNFTKEQLIEKVLMQEAQLLESVEKYSKLFNENSSMKKQFDSMQRKLDRYNTDDELVKKVLEYRARTMSPIKILEKFHLDGIEKFDLQKIKDVITTELSTENQLHFDKCRKEYIESLKINTTLYKQSSIDEIQCLIDSAQEDLMSCDSDDIKLRTSLRTEIANYTEKRDKLMKNIDDVGNNTEQDDILNESTENFKESSKQMLKMSEIRVIGVC